MRVQSRTKAYTEQTESPGKGQGGKGEGWEGWGRNAGTVRVR